MSVIIIDGPEKAGKSTIVEALTASLARADIETEAVHWGPVSPDDRAYTEKLKIHTGTTRKVYVWDRGWPSEYVYGRLLKRKDHRMTRDPWIGAWLHDRAVAAGGLRVMLLGPSISRIAELRTGDDLRVNPARERALYREYATRFGWYAIENKHEPHAAEVYAALLLHKFRTANAIQVATPPHWAGPWGAEVVVVGEELSAKVIPGGWLPFTSPLTTKLGRMMGDSAIKYAWVNAHDCPPHLLRGRKVIVACGVKAQTWVDNYVLKGDSSRAPTHVIKIPHPSYLFRYQNGKTKAAMTEVDAKLEGLR